MTTEPMKASEVKRAPTLDTLPPFADGGMGDLMLRGGYAYLEDYVLSQDDGPDHEPTDFERFMLEDFMNGLLADEAMFGPVRALLANHSDTVAALKDLVALVEDMAESDWHEMDRARAAIAKAEGR